MQDYNESAVFLAFHPSQLQDRQGAKLPLTIYESVLESENHDAGKDMQIDGQESPSNIRFRELPYSVETGEAEMIGVDTIAKGSGTATRTEAPAQVPAAGSSRRATDQKQKQKEAGQSTQAELSQEEEECTPVLAQISDIFITDSRISDCKPQHPPKRRPHSRIPRLTYQILRLQRLQHRHLKRRP